MQFDNDDEIRYTHYRIYSMIALLLVALIAFGVALFNTQIVHGEEYLAQSVRTITLKETVNASRGNLTDRNGQLLVSNRSSYTLTFDASLLAKDEDVNAAILRLLELCRDRGIVWTDNLPISNTQPFTYTIDAADSTQRSRFLKFLQKVDTKSPWVSSGLDVTLMTPSYLESVGLSAPDLLTRLREKFALDEDFTELEARMILGVQYELAIRKLVNTTAYVLAEDVDTELVSLLADGNYRGAKVEASTVREYKTDQAAHILGYVGRIFEEELPALKEQGYAMDDWIGKEGAEKAFEQYLRGTDGTRVVTTNAEGKVTSELYQTQPQPGNNVALTIDLDFQTAVEDALEETITGMTRKDGIARGAGAAVVSVGSGEVLALASYPTYNLATFNQDFTALNADAARPLFNRAAQGTYPPGSTFKPVTAVAALEEGVITSQQTIRDTGKWVYPGSSDYTYCWNRGGHGPVNTAKAITVSCNYYFAELGYRLGMDRLNQYALAFGLGENTGIEIGDAKGNLAENKAGENQAPWAAYGQASYLFSPLQLANYTATLAGGGAHYDAHLLKSIKSYDNSQVLNSGEVEPKNVVAMSESTLNAVKKGMYDLTTKGSLTSYFKSCVVPAGAKTGTAQVNTQKKDNNGVFICFAPYDDPQIAVAIAIEKGGSGAALANTAVTILNAYFTAEQVGAVLVGEGTLLP